MISPMSASSSSSRNSIPVPHEAFRSAHGPPAQAVACPPRGAMPVGPPLPDCARCPSRHSEVTIAIVLTAMSATVLTIPRAITTVTTYGLAR